MNARHFFSIFWCIDGVGCVIKYQSKSVCSNFNKKVGIPSREREREKFLLIHLASLD